MLTIAHPQGVIAVSDAAAGREVEVTPSAGTYVQGSRWRTAYPVELIEAIAAVKGAAYVCDEIRRDEDPNYIEQHLKTTLFAFVRPEAFEGTRLLDFGCGCGASTMVFARHLPKTELVGVELEEAHLEVARKRAAFYGRPGIRFARSPSGGELPPGLGVFDFIFLPAVYEHLLPSERGPLTQLLWGALRPGGVLFVDETPHRWFPIEHHTTGLPLLNYLPAGLAGACARRLSRRNLNGATWPTLLRKGIRGTTGGEVLRRVRECGGEAELLRPLGDRSLVDVWYEGYARHAPGGGGRAKRALHPVLQAVHAVTRIALVPYVSLAFRKQH